MPLRAQCHAKARAFDLIIERAHRFLGLWTECGIEIENRPIAHVNRLRLRTAREAASAGYSCIIESCEAMSSAAQRHCHQQSPIRRSPHLGRAPCLERIVHLRYFCQLRLRVGAGACVQPVTQHGLNSAFKLSMRTQCSSCRGHAAETGGTEPRAPGK